MLEKLTPEQESKMLEVKQFWLDYINSCKNTEINKNAAKIGIDWMYELAGKKPPIIIYVDSPLGCQYAVAYLKEIVKRFPIGKTDQVRNQVWNQVWNQAGNQVWNQVWNQVRNQVRDQVGDQVRDQVWNQVWNQVGDQVRDQVWNQVWNQAGNQVWNQVWNQVRDQVRNQVRDQVRDQVGDQVRNQVGDQYENFANLGIYDYSWISFYDFFTQIGVINHKKFNQFKDAILSGIYDCIQLEGFCIVSSLPTKINRDSSNRLHCSNDYAIEFKDGYKLAFWHGVSVPEWWLLNTDAITKETIINESNAEKRRCLMEILGETKYAELLDLSEIAKEEYNGRDVILYKTKQKDTLINDYIYFIKVECPSTGRYYYLCIPPNEATDPISALSWTFGLNKKEYQLLIET